MNRKFRLIQSTEFMRVRRFGKSYAHPLIVLVVLPADDQNVQIGITAGRSVGKAFERNRAKRMLREAVRPLLSKIESGWEIILIARRPLLKASLPEIEDALNQQIRKANLLKETNATVAQP